LGELPLEEYEFEYEYEKGEKVPEPREAENLFTVSYNNYLSDGTFGASDLAVGGSYAHRLSRRVFVGGTVKLIYESIQDYSSTGLAFDAGFIFRFEDGRTQIGGAITNLGTQLAALGEEKESLLPPWGKRKRASRLWPRSVSRIACEVCRSFCV